MTNLKVIFEIDKEWKLDSLQDSLFVQRVLHLFQFHNLTQVEHLKFFYVRYRILCHCEPYFGIQYFFDAARAVTWHNKLIQKLTLPFQKLLNSALPPAITQIITSGFAFATPRAITFRIAVAKVANLK